MTDVRSDDFTLIHSIDDVLPLYQGNGEDESRQYIGFETEICLYKQGPDGTPVAASAQDCAALLQLLKERGHQPQLEMASAVEYASPARPVTEAALLTAEIKSALEDYADAIHDRGLIASDTALLPFVTLESAGQNIVDRDRARGLVKGMQLFKAPEFLKVTLLCTSTQVSLSYRDPDDLYSLLSTGYALSAAIYGVFGNYPAYAEGCDTRLDTNPRAAFYDAFGRDGGIPDSLLHARDGQDFLRRHAAQVFTTDMLFYYDHDKNIVWPEKPVTFENLREKGLNTRSNYDLAESFVYTDIKVCNIRNALGAPTGKRIEIRGIDAGHVGALAAVPFAHALLRDADSRDAVTGLLADYGLTPGQQGWQDRLVQGRHAAAFHGGKYLDVPFGTRPDGTPGTLKDFCRDLGVILQRYAARNPAQAAALAPLLDICAHGVTQAERLAQQTPDYAQACRNLLVANENAKAAQPHRKVVQGPVRR